MYADIKGFTALSSRVSPQKLVKILNELFSKFDILAEVRITSGLMSVNCSKTLWSVLTFDAIGNPNLVMYKGDLLLGYTFSFSISNNNSEVTVFQGLVKFKMVAIHTKLHDFFRNINYY